MKSTYLASFVTRSSHCVASLGATIPHPAIPPPKRILVRPVCAQRSKYARAPPAHVPFTSTTTVQELPFGLAPSGSLNGCARRRLDSLRRRAAARRSNTPHRTRTAQLSHAGKLHSNEAPFPRNQPAVSAHIVSAANVAQRMMHAAAASANAISPPSIKATPIQTNRFTFMSPPWRDCRSVVARAPTRRPAHRRDAIRFQSINANNANCAPTDSRASRRLNARRLADVAARIDQCDADQRDAAAQ